MAKRAKRKARAKPASATLAKKRKPGRGGTDVIQGAAKPASPHRTPAERARDYERVALALQGGGALGAYQAGVYEGLAEAQEPASRRLIAHLGLDWDEACLNYHETERTVGTISRWQVRQPIYTSSVKRWANYEAHLEPLFAALGDLAVR